MADGILAVVSVIRVYVMVGVSLGVILGSVRLSKVQVEMQEIEKRFKNSDRKKMRKIDKGMETGKRAFCFYNSQSQGDRRRRGLWLQDRVTTARQWTKKMEKKLSWNQSKKPLPLYGSTRPSFSGSSPSHMRCTPSTDSTLTGAGPGTGTGIPLGH